MYLFYFLFLVGTVRASVNDTNNYCKNLMCKSVLFGNDNTDNNNYRRLCHWDIYNFEHYNMMRKDAECSWAKNNSLKYKIIKNETGLVSFKFNYQPVNCKYTNVSAVELFVIENKMEVLHSSVHRKYIIVENKQFSVNFKYVFTGTYFIKINAQKSPRMKIKTQYKLKKLDNDSVGLIVIPPNENVLNKILKVKVNLIQSYFFNELPQITIMFMSKMRRKYFLFSNYSMVSNTCMINSSCNYENTSFTCLYENVEPGNYTFMFKLNDRIRCNMCSVFCEYPYEHCCWFQTQIEINRINTSNEATEDDKNGIFSYEFIIIVTIVSLTMIVIFVKCCKISSKYHSISNATPSNKCVFDRDYPFDQNLEIFLLYARDAEAFMKMIECFKNLIKTDDTITICDIYDYDEKNEDPLRWLEEKLVDDNIKIILFLNECASLVYRHQTNVYKEPHCFDHLFVHSIVFLINSKLKKSYENIFVTKLSCVSNDECFNFLNPLVRYSMPQHVHQLLDDVCSTQINNVDKALMNNFKKSCIECLKFYENNIDYMYRILNVQQK